MQTDGCPIIGMFASFNTTYLLDNSAYFIIPPHVEFFMIGIHE